MAQLRTQAAVRHDAATKGDSTSRVSLPVQPTQKTQQQTTTQNFKYVPNAASPSTRWIQREGLKSKHAKTRFKKKKNEIYSILIFY